MATVLLVGRAVVMASAITLAFSTTAGAQSRADKSYLQKASQGSVAEIAFAQLALKKTSNGEIKNFAKRMIQDHEAMAQTLKPFVQAADLPPSPKLDMEHEDLYKRFQKLAEPEFDREYIDTLEKEHHQSLQETAKELRSTDDASLKAAVEQNDSVLTQHTVVLDGLAKSVGLPLAKK